MSSPAIHGMVPPTGAAAAAIPAGSVRRLGGSAAAVGEGLRRTRDEYLAAERAAAEAFTGIVP